LFQDLEDLVARALHLGPNDLLFLLEPDLEQVGVIQAVVAAAVLLEEILVLDGSRNRLISIPEPPLVSVGVERTAGRVEEDDGLVSTVRSSCVPGRGPLANSLIAGTLVFVIFTGCRREPLCRTFTSFAVPRSTGFASES
jgi:hypothetical protein